MDSEHRTTTRSRVLYTWTLTKNVVDGLFTHHAFDHAATMAFYFFLGLIPLLFCAGLLVGTFVQREGAEELVTPLYRAMPAVAANLFRSELREVAKANVHTVAPLSVLGFVWLTTNGVHNLMDVFEILTNSRQRAWWKQRLLSIAWLGAAIAVVALATWLLLLVNGMALRSTSATHIPQLALRVSDFLAKGWHRVGVLVVFGALSNVGLAVFYRIAVVHPHGVRRRVWPGTIVAHVLWVLVSWAFGAYVSTMGNYAIFYGSLATVAVILLWLYLTSLALVAGAEVNAQLEGVRIVKEL